MVRQYNLGPRHARIAAAIVALGGAAGWTGAAYAQALDIDAPDIEAGEQELRFINGFNGGWRAGSAGKPRSTNKISYAYSPNDWLRLVAHVEAANVIADGWLADHVAFESFISLRKAPDDAGIALSWYTSAQTAINDQGTSSLLFGPVVRFTSDKTSLTINQLFEETVGSSAAPGINAIFGWQLKRELNEHLSIGLELYGTVANIGDAPVWDEQDHRVGPSLYFSWDGDDKRKFGLDAGVLVGLTDASPDVTFKVNFGVVR